MIFVLQIENSWWPVAFCPAGTFFAAGSTMTSVSPESSPETSPAPQSASAFGSFSSGAAAGIVLLYALVLLKSRGSALGAPALHDFLTSCSQAHCPAYWWLLLMLSRSGFRFSLPYSDSGNARNSTSSVISSFFSLLPSPQHYRLPSH